MEVLDLADDLVHVDAESCFVLGFAEAIQFVDHS